jgi:predicted nucleic acid-binding protein
MILLDTDIMIDILREYPPALIWIKSIPEDEIALPGFVIFELLQGCRNKKELESIKQKTSYYKLLWPSEDIYEKALDIFSSCHLSHNTGMLDVIIGHMTATMNLPLYTFNEKHYSVIPELKIIKPYKKG